MLLNILGTYTALLSRSIGQEVLRAYLPKQATINKYPWTPLNLANPLNQYRRGVDAHMKSAHSAHWYLFFAFSNFLSFRRQEIYDCLYKTEKPIGEEKDMAQTAWRKDGLQETEAAKSLERSRAFSSNHDRLLSVRCLPNYHFQSRHNTQSVKIRRLLARETGHFKACFFSRRAYKSTSQGSSYPPPGP